MLVQSLNLKSWLVVIALITATPARGMPATPQLNGFIPIHRWHTAGQLRQNGEDVDAMFFKNYGVNPFVDTEDDHLSTFATDVDTGSYTVARRYLHDGNIPPNEAVRVEEFVNYFDYGYPAPQKRYVCRLRRSVPMGSLAGNAIIHISCV